MRPQIKNTVIRDNVRNNRLIAVSSDIMRVVDAPEFQRLRGIRQLGLTSCVFPTADHSRFAHSLGVLATATEVYAALKIKAEPCMLTVPGLRFDDASELDFCLAAMCHDLGHTAFSHVLENVLLPAGMRRHEQCTKELLLNGGPVSTAISRIADIDSILLFMDREHPNKALSSLISGPFDVDRCDYLLRDSAMTGVDYGHFDLAWLIHSMSIDINTLNQPVLTLDGPRGLDALRQFLAARRYMHRQIYFHPTVRAAQVLLRGIFDRILDVGVPEAISSSAPYGLRNFLRGSDVTTGDFIETQDADVQILIKLLARESTDETLKIMSEMFLRREYPKCVLDSAKSFRSFEEAHGISDAYEPVLEQHPQQLALWSESNPIRVAEYEAECRSIVSDRLQASGKPRDLAQYLVVSDRRTFKSDPPTDFMFSYGEHNVPLESIDSKAVGYNLPRLMESFQLFRFFAPSEFTGALRSLAQDHALSRRADDGFS